MIYAEIVHGSNGLTQQYDIRKKVFIEEQGVYESIERDEYDRDCSHVLVYEDDIAVATGRIIYVNNIPLIGRIAVLKEYRGKQYGDLVVRKLVDQCFRQGEKRVEVHAQLSVIKFYEGIGFVAYGDDYLESNILHRSMYITQESIVTKCRQ
jgi:predicted GNAT family N-acyltransferase